MTPEEAYKRYGSTIKAFYGMVDENNIMREALVELSKWDKIHPGVADMARETLQKINDSKDSDNPTN